MFSIPNSLKKKFLPKSLLTRFMLIIIVPTLIGQLIAVYLFYERHWYNVSQHASGLIATEISALIHSKSYDRQPHQKRNYLNLEYVFMPNTASPPAQTKYIAELEIFKKILKKKISQEGIAILDTNGRIKLYLQIENDLLQIRLPYKSLLNPTTYIFVLWIVMFAVATWNKAPGW